MNTCTVSDIERLIGEIAPFELAEEWDNVGLLFGRRNAEVTRVVVALDLTQAAVDKAKALGAQMIVTHHPIMFGAVKRVTDETREGRLMLDMGQAGISHAAAHTNLDAAQGGVNDTLMRVMGAENVRGEGFVRVATCPRGRSSASSARGRRRSCMPPCARSATRKRPVHALGCAPARAEAKRRGTGAGRGLLHHRRGAPPRGVGRAGPGDAASSRRGILKRKTRSAKCSPTLYKRRRMRYNIT